MPIVSSSLKKKKPAVFAPAPAIGNVFAEVVYAGNSSNQSLATPLSDFDQGGLFWAKSISGAPGIYSHSLWDTVRGAANGRIFTNTTAAHDGSPLPAFTSNGVNLNGNYQNTSGAVYIGWFIKQADSFFKSFLYSGDGTKNRVLNHALKNNPGMIWIKRYDATGDWSVWHRGAGGIQLLNRQDGMSIPNDIFNVGSTSFMIGNPETNPSTPVFQLNEIGGQYIVMVFAHDVSPSSAIKCDSFVTDATGKAVVSGTWPAKFIITKRKYNASNWDIRSAKLGIAKAPAVESTYLRADTSDNMASNNNFANTADGFTISGLSPQETYIYMAFRD